MADCENPYDQQASLRFFGWITANLSHEINNIITIIGETSGLLDDLASMAARGKPLNPDKLKTLAGNITRQVERGKETISHMNRFAHSPDEPRRQIDLNSLAENLVHLTRRLAQQKKRELILNKAEEPVSITTNPFLLREAIFRCVAMTLDAPDASGSISISLKKGPQEVLVCIESEAPSHDVSKTASDYLECLLRELQGRIEIKGMEGAFALEMTLPVFITEKRL